MPRLPQAHGGCPLDAFACNKMKREPRGAAFPELRASCVPKLRASVPALKFRKNFDKHFKIFESSYPHPTFDQRSGTWLKLRWGYSDGMRQVPRSSKKPDKESRKIGVERSGDSRIGRAPHPIWKKFGCIGVDFCQERKVLTKILIIFNHFSDY